MRRLVTSVAALAFVATPISILAVGGATPAGATTKVPASIVCTKVSGPATGKVTISGCTVPTADKKTYASASVNPGIDLATGGTLKWTSSTKTTKISKPTVVQGTGCAAGSTEYTASGTVVKGSTAVITPVGQHFSVHICLNSTTEQISLVKNTKADI
jgi:hypothetical protein